MDIIVSDLDGTLLDHDTYSFAGALGALSVIRDAGAKLVLCSSKTRTEMEQWRQWIGSRDPFIVENGGAVIWDAGYFPGDATRLELGAPYADLRRALADSAKAARAVVRGFGDMTVQEVAERCGIPEYEAELAKQREYDEPFVVEKGSETKLEAQIIQRGLRCLRGGRFFHILGGNDKGAAVKKLLAMYAESGDPVHSLGLGDAPNDASMLKAATNAVVMPSPQAAALRKLVPRATMADAPGAVGWNRAVIEWLGRNGDFWERQR
ncbi:MAG: HAD hydrolase family protein [Bryobacteraceae bacterium]